MLEALSSAFKGDRTVWQDSGADARQASFARLSNPALTHESIWLGVLCPCWLLGPCP